MEMIRNHDMNRASKCSGTTSLKRYQNTEVTKVLKKVNMTRIPPLVQIAKVVWLKPAPVPPQIRKSHAEIWSE